MDQKESDKNRPQREADRRKRQAAALKANLRRRKDANEIADNRTESDDNAA